MSKRGKIIIISVAITLVLLIGGAFSWLYLFGGWQLLADYTAAPSPWNLTDGYALSGPEIGAYLHARNPNIPVEAGDKMAKHCVDLQVNPAFALGIAEADSSTGQAGVGMHYKNPGNTKISYGRLDELGIGHSSYRAGQNFASFDDWGDGFSAICVTLANYRYYNLNGSVNMILRTYAGDPNPNYYGAVNRVMSQLLSNITISGVVVEDGTSNTVKVQDATVALKNDDGSVNAVVQSDAAGGFSFGTLSRRPYVIEVSKKDYLTFIYDASSVHQNNYILATLVANNAIRDPEKHPLLAGHGFIKGQIHRIIIDPMNKSRVTLKATNIATGEVFNTTSDESGNYIFYNIPKGTYRVEVQKESNVLSGFYYAKEIQLMDVAVVEADFYL